MFVAGIRTCEGRHRAGVAGLQVLRVEAAQRGEGGARLLQGPVALARGGAVHGAVCGAVSGAVCGAALAGGAAGGPAAARPERQRQLGGGRGAVNQRRRGDRRVAARRRAGAGLAVLLVVALLALAVLALAQQ